MEFNDYEIVSMVQENSEDAKDLIYEKYNYIIDIILAKYKKTFYILGIDPKEARQDALLAFSDAIIKYSQDKDTSLSTFITIVVERKIQNCIRNAESIKHQKNRESYSLDFEYEAIDKSLIDIIGDPDSDPLVKIESKESYQELVSKIKSALSPLEYDVYKLMINDFGYIDIAKILDKDPKQIDNTIQRIRAKIKDLINS